MIFKVGTILRHKRGSLYIVTGTSVHTETEEYMLEYRCLSTWAKWSRPASMFTPDRFVEVRLKNTNRPVSSNLCTCTDCEEWWWCPVAFDPYNTAGDCLFVK